MLERLIHVLSRTEVWMLALGTAAFLTLFWALRGAPAGLPAEEEADDEAPAAGYRDRVIAAVIVGLLLVAAGGYLALTKGVPWSLPAFAAGFGIVLTLISVNQRHRHASPALRRAVDFSQLALTASLVAGILIVINVLAFRYGGRALDLTRERSFSLSTLTTNQLRDLDRPVTFTVLFGEGPLAAPQRTRVAELLDLYRAANPKMIRIESINPFLQSERVEALAKRFPDVPLPQEGGVLIETGEGDASQHALVRNNDLFEAPRAGHFDRYESTFRGEDAITSALIGLRERKKPKFVFTTGHGEPSINANDLRRPGVGLFRSRLGAVGIEAVVVSLLAEDLPAETGLLVIIAPQSPFKPEEVAKVRKYADHGGPVLLMLGNLKESGLDDLLRTANVALGKGVIIDPKLNLPGRPNVVFIPVSRSIKNPITDPLLDRYVLMPNAAPLHLLGVGGTKPANPGVTAAVLLRSSPEAWAETDSRPINRDPGKDEVGPLNVGVAVSTRPQPGDPKPGTPKMVIFTSAGLADNATLEIEPTNIDLLMNAIAWLRGRAELKGIAPKTHVSLRLTADPVLRTRLVLVPTVLAVLGIIGLGVTTYAARRA